MHLSSVILFLGVQYSLNLVKSGCTFSLSPSGIDQVLKIFHPSSPIMYKTALHFSLSPLLFMAKSKYSSILSCQTRQRSVRLLSSVVKCICEVGFSLSDIFNWSSLSWLFLFFLSLLPQAYSNFFFP